VVVAVDCRAVSAMAIAKQARGWSQPSDHVPVTATIEL
jgi:hypothetical protein